MDCRRDCGQLNSRWWIVVGDLVSQFAEPKITLLLTATINPRDCSFVARNDPSLRLQDYLSSMKRWIADPSIDDIVFCENSGYCLQEIRGVIVSNKSYGKRIRLLSYKSRAHGKRGKGYGELGIIRKVLTSCQISDSAYLLKVSGRYFVENIGDIVQQLKSTRDSVITGPFMLPFPGTIASECFCGSVAFFKQHLCPMQDWLDDSRGRWFETALLRAIANAKAAGLSHSAFKTVPILSGFSGASGLPWSETYTANAPILNSDGTITVRNGAQLLILGVIVERYLTSLRTEAVEDPRLEGIVELLERLGASADEARKPVLTRRDLIFIQEAAVYCIKQSSRGIMLDLGVELVTDVLNLFKSD